MRKVFTQTMLAVVVGVGGGGYAGGGADGAVFVRVFKNAGRVEVLIGNDGKGNGSESESILVVVWSAAASRRTPYHGEVVFSYKHERFYK